MAGFLTDFLSLGSGALAAQALYFLFVTYPYELRRHKAELDVATEQFKGESASWKKTFDLLDEAYCFAVDLLKKWKGMDNSAERAKTRYEIEERWWNIKALYRIEGEPIARTLRLLEEVLGNIHQTLLKEGGPSIDDHVSLNLQAQALGKSVSAIQRMEKDTSDLNKAKTGGIKNELNSLCVLRLWSRVGLLVYGLLVAVASAVAIFRSEVRWHSSLAYADAIVFVALTIAMLWYSFYQEKHLATLVHTTDGKENAGGK
jgi:hypothetical protein